MENSWAWKVEIQAVSSGRAAASAASRAARRSVANWMRSSPLCWREGSRVRSRPSAPISASCAASVRQGPGCRRAWPSEATRMFWSRASIIRVRRVRLVLVGLQGVLAHVLERSLEGTGSADDEGEEIGCQRGAIGGVPLGGYA